MGVFRFLHVCVCNSLFLPLLPFLLKKYHTSKSMIILNSSMTNFLFIQLLHKSNTTIAIIWLCIMLAHLGLATAFQTDYSFTPTMNHSHAIIYHMTA